MRTVDAVSVEVVGFGPIEFLLKDPEVTEVMAVGPNDVHVKREGGSRGLEREQRRRATRISRHSVKCSRHGVRER